MNDRRYLSIVGVTVKSCSLTSFEVVCRGIREEELFVQIFCE